MKNGGEDMWYLIGAAELEMYLDEGRKMKLVDLRSRSSYARGHIQGAVNIPYEELGNRLSELPDNQLIVLYCRRGSKSILAARELSRLGYQVADVYGGILMYRGKYFCC